MKTVSLQELKSRIFALLAEVAAGSTVLITKDGRPIAVLSLPEADHLHTGKRFGRGSLGPLLHRATAGRYLEVLAEDRGGQRGTGD
jgi:antitoxin (DNA-binding transcriptional repressor) of toxin-antitoxin stability system